MEKISIVFSIPPSVRFFSLILSHVSFIIAIYYLHCRYLLSASSSFSKSLVYSQFVQTVCTNSKSYSLIFADFFHYNMPFLQKQSIKRLQCSPNPHPKSNTLLFFISGNIENNAGISNKLLAFILLSLIFLYPSKNTSLSYIFCCAILSSINFNFILYCTTHTSYIPLTFF